MNNSNVYLEKKDKHIETTTLDDYGRNVIKKIIDPQQNNVNEVKQ